MSLRKIISGGQSGADFGAWKAAQRFGLETGGWMPLGFRTEDGPRPGYAELFGAREHALGGYPPRTRDNIKLADETIIFNLGMNASPGTMLAGRMAGELGKPVTIIWLAQRDWTPSVSPQQMACWLIKRRVEVLNVAGNRESSAIGMADFVERYLVETFQRMGIVEVNHVAC